MSALAEAADPPRRRGAPSGEPLGHNARMRLGPRTAALCLLLVTGFLVDAGPARADGPSPTTLTLTAAPVHADETTTLEVDLTQPDAESTDPSHDEVPVAGAQVEVERKTDGAWTSLGTVVTDEAGHAGLGATLARTDADNVFRATYAGDAAHAPAATGPVPVALVRRGSRVASAAPTRSSTSSG